MKLVLSTIAASFVLIAACSTTASGQDPRSLYYAADDYRDAVVRFEDQARRVRSLDRFTLRLVDRLEDQTSALRSATRRVNDLSRLLYEFNEIESLKPRVEQAVFGTGCPIIQAALGPSWNESIVAYSRLLSEVQAIQSPRYQSGFGSRPSCGPPLNSPSQGLQPTFPFAPTFPNAPIPPVAIPRSSVPFGPQANFRFPQPDRRFDRHQSARPSSSSLIIGGLLSRLARGL